MIELEKFSDLNQNDLKLVQGGSISITVGGLLALATAAAGLGTGYIVGRR